MKFIWSVLLFGLFSFTSRAEVQISVITTTSGDLPHTLFGHTALRVLDDSNDFDKIYNFGMFDFSTPNFVYVFLRGDLDYWGGRQSTESFIDMNNRENRWVHEQVLNLTEEQKQGILDQLDYRTQKEHKHFKYSFSHQNCVTIVNDILYEEGVLQEDYQTDLTIRKVIEEALKEHLWYRFGINMILGILSDRKISYRESHLMPSFLEEDIAETKGLVLQSNTLNYIEKKPPSIWLSYLTSPVLIFTVLIFVFLYYCPLWIRILVFLTIGSLGVIVCGLWAITYHPEFQYNLNVLWANPLFLIYLLLRLFGKKSIILLKIGILGLMLTSLIWLIQIHHFDWAVLPLLFAQMIVISKELESINPRVND